MLRGCLGILLPLLIVGVTAGAWAQGDEESERLAEALSREPFTITADEVSYAQGREVLEASGNVRIEQKGGRTLEADWVTYNPQTRIGVAVGNVRMQAGTERLTAEFATVDFDSLQALATDATLVSTESGFVVRGEALEKTGAETYKAASARFTTCACKKPDERLPWEVETGEADVRIEGYAVARDVKFRILDVPVMYTPYLILPVKTKRQTGFLMPDFGRSNRNGGELEVPFFWAARDDTNVLIRPRWMTDRGVKAAFDFEHVFAEEGYSDGGGAILPNDDDVDRDDPDTDYSDNRWAFWLRHEQPFAEGLRFGTDIQRASDNDYPLDFDEDLGPAASHSRFLEADGWLSGARGGRLALGRAKRPLRRRRAGVQRGPAEPQPVRPRRQPATAPAGGPGRGAAAQARTPPTLRERRHPLHLLLQLGRRRRLRGRRGGRWPVLRHRGRRAVRHG
jgi:LPS-assembly protein